MNTTESVPVQSDVHQILASAVAHQVERMSKEEVQALLAKSHLELQNENAALKKRIEQFEEESAKHAQAIEKLEADKVRLYYQIGRLQFSEKEWEDFDPSEYTVPVEEMLADMDKLLNESAEPGHG